MLADERAKQLMEQVGLPNSRSLLQALRQCDMEARLAEREACAKVCEKHAAEAWDQEGGALNCAERIRAR